MNNPLLYLLIAGIISTTTYVVQEWFQAQIDLVRLRAGLPVQGAFQGGITRITQSSDNEPET